VPQFLSDEWISSLDRAVRGADASALSPLTLEQIVRGVPGRGDVCYRLVAADGRLTVVPADARDADADISFNTDYATAVALARGEENAQQALATGRLRLGGNLVLLAARADALAALDDLFAALRSETTYALE
jgi:hypothetical protein